MDSFKKTSSKQADLLFILLIILISILTTEIGVKLSLRRLEVFSLGVEILLNALLVTILFFSLFYILAFRFLLIEVKKGERVTNEKETLNIISQLFLTSQSLDFVYQELPRILSSRFNFPIVTIELYDQESNNMLLMGAVGVPINNSKPTFVPADQSVSRTVATSGKIVLEMDVSRHPEHGFAVLKELGVETFLSVPMRTKEGLIGALSLGHPGKYRDASLLVGTTQVIADHLAQEIIHKWAEEALRESEKQFRAVFEQAGSSIIVSDSKGEILDFNDKTHKTLGYTREEFNKLTLADIDATASGDEIRNHLKEILKKGVDVFETKQKTKQGEIRDFIVTAKRIKAHGKRLLVIIYQDITERKLAEEALRKSERELNIRNRISEIFLTASDQEMYTKVLQVVLEAMESKFGIFGYIDENGALVVPSITHHLGDKCQVSDQEVPFPRNKGGSGAWSQALRAKKVFYANEPPTNLPEGHVAIRRYISLPILYKRKCIGLFQVANKETDYDEKDLGLLETIADYIAPILHEKLQRNREEKEFECAKEALRVERDMVQKHLDIAEIIVVIINVDQTVSFINKKGCDLLGYCESEIIGKNWFDNFVLDRVREQVRADFEKMITGKFEAKEYYETRISTKDGPERTVGWHYTTLKDDDGKIIATLNSGQDITNYKRAMREIYLLAKFPAESPSPVLRIRKDGCIQFANQASQPILKALGGNLGEFVSDKWKQVIEYVYTSQLNKELELNHRQRIFLITIMPFSDTDYLYVYGSEITERKRAEIELTKHRRHLEHLVKKRTAELEISNQELQNEIHERKQTEEKLRSYQKHLRSLASELSLAEEKERRRIAVGLHDNIGQNLYLSKLKLETLQTLVSSPDFADPLREITEHIDQTIHKTRTLTFELSPPILYELGFEPALKWLIDQIHRQHGIISHFEDDKQPKPLDDEVRVLLYQSVRELLANVVKHAQASRVKLFVLREGNNIRIDLNDDGIGFDTSKINPDEGQNKGFGFFSIRERLDYLGGYLECESEHGLGTRISLVTPLSSTGA